MREVSELSIGSRERFLDRLIAIDEDIDEYSPSFVVGEIVEHHSNCSYLECVGERCVIVKADCPPGFYLAVFGDGEEYVVSNCELTKSN